MPLKPDSVLTLDRAPKSVSIFIGRDAQRPIVTVMHLPSGKYQLLGRIAEKEASRGEMQAMLRELAIKVNKAAEEL